jgi:hypothetical protein
MDELRWAGGDCSGELTVWNVYNAIITTQNLSSVSGWKLNCWKWCDQLKITLFFWLATFNKILTWDALLKKGWIGPRFFTCAEQAQKMPLTCSSIVHLQSGFGLYWRKFNLSIVCGLASPLLNVWMCGS